MNTLLIALQLIPAILKAVKSIEEEVPLPKKGKDKLDFVLDVAGKVSGTATNVAPIVTTIVNSAVKLFKAVGVFR